MNRWNKHKREDTTVEMDSKLKKRIDDYKKLIYNILGYDLPWETNPNDGVNLGKAELEHDYISNESVDLLYRGFHILNLPIRRGKSYPGCRFVIAFIVNASDELSIYIRH